MTIALPDPIGRQKEVVYLPAPGHCVVLGTAGSGKTTMAIIRAAYISRLKPAKKVLLVTFNSTLVTYLKSLGGAELNDVDIRTYHHFARGYLNAKGKMYRNAIIDEKLRLAVIQQVLGEIIQTHGVKIKILERSPESFLEEIRWIARTGVNTEEDYISMERIGREDSRIVRKDRPVVWELYQRYLLTKKQNGFDYDWDDIAQAACNEFASDTDTKMYYHVVIDEGQDFSPVMLKSLAMAADPDGGLTFFGDMAQQIYGSRISWRNAGFKNPKIWYFKENYRNTKQIAQLGLAISNMPFFKGIADLVEPHSPKADGPLPTLVKCNSPDEETAFIVKSAIAMGRTQAVAILTRNRQMDNTFIKAIQLQGRGIKAIKLDRDLDVWEFDPGIFVGTYYSAKSLEFDAVLLPYCNEDMLPDPSRIDALGSKDEALSEEARLLYVAITRAKSRLIITYNGNITELLPKDMSLYYQEA